MKRPARVPMTFEQVTKQLLRLRRVLPAYRPVGGDPLRDSWPYIMVEYKRIPAGHRYPMHSHGKAVHEIYYVNRGAVEVSMPGRRSLVLRPGHAVLFTPRHGHSMSSPAGAGAVNVHFPLTRSEPWTSAIRDLAGRTFEFPAFCRTALNLLVQIDAFPRQARAGLSSNLLGAILLTASVQARPAGDREIEGMSWHGIAGKAIEHMLARPGRKQTVAEIARSISVGKRTLEIAFRRQTGTTVHQASLRMRLDRAHKQLATGGLSVKKVAYNSGFLNPGSFARAFRRVYGFSPAELGLGRGGRAK